jgi:putative transposase
MKEHIDKKVRTICEWKHVELLEMTIMTDHVHLVAIIPPKLAVSELMGIFSRGKRLLPFSGKRKTTN